MWVAFYVPWAVTLAHPVAGLVTTTCFVVYHYMFHREIVQRIELSMLYSPLKIEPHYKKHQNGPTHDSKATGSGKTQPREGETQMEKDELPCTCQGDARGARQDPQASQQVPQKVRPYVWDYATW